MNLASAFGRPWNFRILAITALLAVLPSLLFAKSYKLKPSSIVPGATGEVKTGKDKNGNIKFSVQVQYLAQPAALTPPMSTYVVWIQQHGAAPESQGVLKVDDKLQGKFESSTPDKQFDLWITAENNPTIKSPSGPEVLRAAGIGE